MALDLGRTQADDVVDPLSQRTAFSLLPRTLAAAGFSSATVSSEIQLNQTFSQLIESVRAKESKRLHLEARNPRTDSDAMEEENNENGRNNIDERRPVFPRKRRKFSLIPDITTNTGPIVDYSVLEHIKDPYEYFKTVEQLENAEKEIKRLRGEPTEPVVDCEAAAARRQRVGLGIQRTRHKYTFNLLADDTILQNASPPKNFNTASEGLNAIPSEVTCVIEDAATMRDLNASTTLVEDEEEAMLWESLNLKPTEIPEMNLDKILNFRKDKPVSANKECLIQERSKGTLPGNLHVAILDLQRRILQRSPLVSSSFILPPSDDNDLIGGPFPSSSQIGASSVSPQDVFNSKEKHLESSECLQNEENVMPSYASPSDAANNAVEEIALQNKVSELPQGEVGKDVLSGCENVSSLHAKKDKRIGNNIFASVGHESSLDGKASLQNVNIGAADGLVTGDGDASLRENATDKDGVGGKDVSKDHQSYQLKEAPSIDVSLENPLVNSQEKLVPEESASRKGKKKGGRPRKANKGKSNARTNSCSGSLDMQPEMPPPTSEAEVPVEASHMESPSERKKQKAAPRKQKKRESNRRKSLADGGLVWQSGVRRSTRVKSRPLQHWLGERFLYGRIHDSLATVIGVKTYSPTSKGPVMKVKSFVSDKYKDLVDQVGKY